MRLPTEAVGKFALPSMLALGVLALAAGGFSGAAWAEETLERLRKEGVARVGIGNEPPYSEVLGGGAVTGAAPEVTRAVLEKLGVPEIEAIVVEYGAMIPGLQAGRFDIVAAGLFMKPERCQGALFSEPDVCGVEGMLVKKGNPLEIEGQADIAANPDAKVGMCGGCVEEKYAADANVKRSQIVIVPDVPSGLKMVQDGRIDAYAMPALSLYDIVKKTGATDVEVVAPAKNTPIACAGAAFKKSDVAFRDAYDEALAELKESGEFEEILAEFGFTAEAAYATTRTELCGGPNE